MQAPRLLRLDDIDNISEYFPDWMGKKYNEVADLLYRKYGIPVAHGLETDEFLHAAHQLDEEDRYWHAVPVARQVARKLLG